MLKTLYGASSILICFSWGGDLFEICYQPFVFDGLGRTNQWISIARVAPPITSKLQQQSKDFNLDLSFTSDYFLLVCESWQASISFPVLQINTLLKLNGKGC